VDKTSSAAGAGGVCATNAVRNISIAIRNISIVAGVSPRHRILGIVTSSFDPHNPYSNGLFSSSGVASLDDRKRCLGVPGFSPKPLPPCGA
jgi:hypothetical protein